MGRASRRWDEHVHVRAAQSVFASSTIKHLKVEGLLAHRSSNQVKAQPGFEAQGDEWATPREPALFWYVSNMQSMN